MAVLLHSNWLSLSYFFLLWGFVFQEVRRRETFPSPPLSTSHDHLPQESQSMKDKGVTFENHKNAFLIGPRNTPCGQAVYCLL